MALSLDIIDVVGHTEADHAIEATELITPCAVVHQVIDDSPRHPDPLAGPEVTQRKDRLVKQASTLRDTITSRYPEAIDGDPDQLGAIVRFGRFDAPHLAGNPAALGKVVTVVDGGWDALDPTSGEELDEVNRLAGLSAYSPAGETTSRRLLNSTTPTDR